MAIAVADKLKAMTMEKIIADANEVQYASGDTSANGNTIADHVTKIYNSTVYLSEDAYQALVNANQVKEDVEYNIVEED